MATKKQEPASIETGTQLESIWLPEVDDGLLPGYQGKLFQQLAMGKVANLVIACESHVNTYVAEHAEEQQELITAYNEINIDIDKREQELRERLLSLGLGDDVDVDAMVTGGLSPLLAQKVSLKKEIDEFLLNAHLDAFEAVFLSALGLSLSGSRNGSSGNKLDWAYVHVVDVCKARRVYAHFEDGRLAVYDDKGKHVHTFSKEEADSMSVSTWSATRLQDWHTRFYVDKTPADYTHDPDKGQLASRLAYALGHADWNPNSNGRTNVDDLDANRVPKFSITRDDWMKKVAEVNTPK